MEFLPPHDTILSAVHRVVGPAAVGLSSVLAFAQSVDAGMIATSIGVVGLAAAGVYSEVARRRREARNLDEQARRDNEKVALEAKIEMDRRALEAQIALDERREKAYAGKLLQQVEQLQASLDEGNRRVEAANEKLHELRGEQNAARLQWEADREEFKERLEAKARMLARFEAENRQLLLLLDGKVVENQTAINRQSAAIDGLVVASATGAAAPPQRTSTEGAPDEL